MTEELKPCPLCGSTEIHTYEPTVYEIGNDASVNCENPICGVEVRGLTLKHAIAKWNRRERNETLTGNAVATYTKIENSQDLCEICKKKRVKCNMTIDISSKGLHISVYLCNRCANAWAHGYNTGITCGWENCVQNRGDSE